MMNILIRVDSNAIIGQGHLMRCLSLAFFLNSLKMRVVFCIYNDIPKLVDNVHVKGFQVFELDRTSYSIEDFSTKDAEKTIEMIKQSNINFDFLIVDHYQIDRTWELAVRPYVKKIMVIDDLANRTHDCDVLLDQNIYDEQSHYATLLPKHATTLLGPQFALLRPEFLYHRARTHIRKDRIKKVLIFFGGGDCSKETMAAIQNTRMVQTADLSIDVIVGAASAEQDNIKKLCQATPNTNYFCQTDNIAELMLKADVALGSGGGITWERCCLGLPSIVQAIAENQVKNAENLAKLNVLMYLGKSKDIRNKEVIQALTTLIDDPNKLQELSHQSFQLVDGLGCQRVGYFLRDMN